MVGILLCVFVSQEHHTAVHNLQAEVVECGVMRVLGNKGAVSIRFNIYETSVCFVNSHLAAFAHNTERRNQDWADIMKFTSFKILEESNYNTTLTERTIGILDHE
jgi:phosphatidylinositol-bisphosphatase